MSNRRLPIPYPVAAENTVLVEREDVAIAIRGIGVTEQAISFGLQVITAFDYDFGIGYPFNMPHIEPNQAAFTVRAHWQFSNNQAQEDDSIYGINSQGARTGGGSWGWQPQIEAWQGEFSMVYPLEVRKLSIFEVAITWDEQQVSSTISLSGHTLIEALSGPSN